MLFAALAFVAAAGQPLPNLGRNAAAFILHGWNQESAHTPDLDKDGKLDLVLIVRAPDNEDRRLLAARSTPAGYRKIGEAILPPYPLGDASVTFTDKGVLEVEDLIGGTTATQSTMRYRYAPAMAGWPAGRMRYIGLDLTNYSRTNRHDATTLSYNWLTGDWSRQTDKLTRRGGYAPQPPKRAKGKPRDLYMEDTADPDDFLSAEQGRNDKE